MELYSADVYLLRIRPLFTEKLIRDLISGWLCTTQVTLIKRTCLLQKKIL